MARPLARIDELRTLRVLVYLTDIEKDAIDKKAKSAGLPTSVFLRRSGLAQKVVALPTGAIERWQELGKLGGLLNQIAHGLNAGTVNNVPLELLAAIHDTQENVRQLRVELMGVSA
jgi:hypothetical protein